MQSTNPPGGQKPTDVGYKRPPVEHRFSSDNQPKARKKQKEVAKPPTVVELIIKILDEEHRVEIGGKVHWHTKARLLLMTAFRLAENGNPTLSRALLDLFLKNTDSSSVNEPLLQTQRKDGTWSTTTMSGRPSEPECFN